MTTYKTISAWRVLDEIENGKQVFMLDRQNNSVALVNDLNVNSAVKVLNSDDKENRYAFWICEESEETESEESEESEETKLL